MYAIIVFFNIHNHNTIQLCSDDKQTRRKQSASKAHSKPTESDKQCAQSVTIIKPISQSDLNLLITVNESHILCPDTG